MTQGFPGGDTEQLGSAHKRCSIVFIGACNSNEARRCLSLMGTDQLAADCELLFVDDGRPETEVVCPRTTDATVRNVKIGPVSGFDRLCLEAAKQARGEYVLFVKKPINQNQIIEALRSLENTGMSIGTAPEKEYIVARRAALIEASGLRELSQIQQQHNGMRTVKELLGIISSSAGSIAGIFSVLNNNRHYFERTITECLSLVKQDSSNFYELLLLKSLKGYLTSGITFENEPQCVRFYMDLRLAELTEVPWPVGVILAIYQLRKGRPEPVDPGHPGQKQATAILVSVYNETRFTQLCLQSVRMFTNSPYHLVVVNNSTADIEDFKQAAIKDGLVDEWFDSGCTSHGDGLQRSLSRVRQYRYLATLDSDAIALKDNWLQELIDRMNTQGAALIGPQTFRGSTTTIKGFAIHPSCMVIDQQRIAESFQIDFSGNWPFDVGHLVTWNCLARGIPIVKVSHDVDKNYAIGSSLVNKSVRHYWYASRVANLPDDAELDGHKVRTIRQKLETAYNSDELSRIRDAYRAGMSRR